MRLSITLEERLPSVVDGIMITEVESERGVDIVLINEQTALYWINVYLPIL